MTLLAPSPITAQEWRARCASGNGPTPQFVKTSAATTGAARWDAIIGQIVALRNLEDDWDGLGAMAPTHELVDSAIGLAYLLKDAGVDAADAAIVGSDGSVNFVWHGPNGSYCGSGKGVSQEKVSGTFSDRSGKGVRSGKGRSGKGVRNLFRSKNVPDTFSDHSNMGAVLRNILLRASSRLIIRITLPSFAVEKALCLPLAQQKRKKVSELAELAASVPSRE